MPLALIKSLLLIGAVLLIGAGLVRFILLPGGPWRLTRQLAVAGALLLIVMGLTEVAVNLDNIFGFVDPDMYRAYLQDTRHGQAVVARSVLAAALAALVLFARGRGAAVALVLLGVPLLATFSMTSHAAAMGGTQPMLADLVHFLAAATWAGAILYTVLSGLWQPDRLADLQKVMRRVAVLGLLAVLILATSGGITTLIHAGEPETFVGSPWASALLWKLGAVALTIAVAAVNRFVYVPRLAAGVPRGLRFVMSVEAGLIAAIFILTGVLSTSSLPHGAVTADDMQPATNLIRLIDYLRENQP